MDRRDDDSAGIPRATMAVLLLIAVVLVGIAIGCLTWVLSRPDPGTQCQKVTAQLAPQSEAEFGPLTMNSQCQLVDRNGYVRVDKKFPA